MFGVKELRLSGAIVGLGFIFAGFATQPLRAQTLTWNNGASDATWSATSGSLDWSGFTWTDGNAAVFGPTGVGTVTVSGTVAPTGITFNTAGYTLSGGLINLGSGTSTVTTNAASASIGSKLAGAAGLVVSGTGTLTLTNGNNNYTGGTTLSSGGLTITSQNALGSGTLTLSGGTLTGNPANFVPNAVYASPATNTVLLGGGGGNYLGISGNLTGSGTLTLSGANGGNLRLAGSNSGFSGTAVVTGNDVIFLNSTNVGSSAAVWEVDNGELLGNTSGATYSLGALTSALTTGVLSDDSGSETFSVGALNTNTTYNGAIQGATSLIKVGSGTLTLTANNSNTGGTTLNSGGLTITNNSALGSGLLTLSGGTLFGNGTGSVSNSATFTAATNTILLGGGGGNFLGLSGNLTGSGTITLSGANSGNIRLAGSNSGFSGTAIISAGGFIFLNSNNAGSSAATWEIDNGTVVGNVSSGTFSLGALTSALTSGALGNNSNTSTYSVGALNTNTTFNGAIQGATSLIKVGSGSLTLGGANSYSGGTSISAGTLQIGAGGSSGAIASTSTVSNSGVLAFNRSDTGLTFSTTITGGGTLAQVGTGRTLLSGNNTYSGGTRITAGTLALGHVNALGGSSAGPLAINGGTLDLAGFSPTAASNLSLTLTSGGIVNSGTAASLTASSYNVQNGTINVSLAGAASALNKTTAGLVTLSGSNAYGGGTTVSTGTLALGAAGTLGSGNLSINSGGVLDVSAYGSGGYTYSGGVLTAGRTAAFATDVNGTLNVQNATVNVAGLGNVGTLTIGGGLGLTGGTLNYVPGDEIVAQSGALSLGGTDYIAPLSTVGTGTYTLFTGTSVPANPSNFLAMTGPYGTNPRQHYVFASSGGTAVTLAVTGVAGNLFWTGGSNNTWDTGASQSWFNTSSGSADVFFTGDDVTFNDTAGTANNVTISGTVNPGSLTVSNTSVNFTFSGTGSIGNGVALIKNGPGTLTVANSNSYAGGTTLSAGVLNANAGYALGTGTVSVGGGTLNANVASALGAAPVSVSGGVLNDAAANSLGSGALSITGGTVNAVNPQSLASATLSGGLLNLASSTALGGVTLTLGGGSLDNTSGAAMTLGGNNPQNWSGGLAFLGSNPLNMGTGAVPLGSSSTLFVNAGTLTVGGVISGGGALTKNGPGLLDLAGANTYNGGTTVSAGTLKLDLTAQTGSATLYAYNVAGPGLLALSNTATSTDNLLLQNITLSGSGTVAKTGPGYLDLGASSSIAGFAGLMDVQAGTLAVNNIGASASASQATLEIDSGATFDVRSNATLAVDKLTGSGTLTHSNTDSLPAISVGNNNGSSTFPGTIQDGGNSVALSENGSGIFALTGTNTYSGGTTVGAGTLQLGGPAALQAAGNLSVAGVLDLDGNSAAVAGFSGSGTINSSASGAMTFTLGNSNATSAFSGAIINGSGTVALVKTGSGTETLSGSSSYGGGTTLSAGGLTITNNNALGSGTLTLSGGTLLGNPTNFVPNAAYASAATNTVLLGGAGSNYLGLSGNLTGSGTLTLASNGGNVRFAGNNSGFAGTIAQSTGQGGLYVNSPNAMSANAAWQIDGTVIANGGNGTYNLGSLSGNSGILDGNGAAYTYSIGALNQSTTFSGVIQNSSGTIALVKVGSGTLALTGPNTFTGGTTISGGTLAAISASSLGATSGAVTIGPATLEIAAGFASDRNVNLNNPLAAIQVDSGLVYSNGGTVSGSGGLTKTGAGTLVLSGSGNSFSGGTIVNSGVLQLGNSAALGTGSLAANGGTLDLAGYGTTVYGLSGAAGTITDSSTSAGATPFTVNQSASTTFAGSIQTGPNGRKVSLVQQGSGSLTLSGIDVVGSATVQNTGTLQITGSLMAGGVNIDAGAQLAGNGSITLGGDGLLYASSASSAFAGTVAGSQGGIEVDSGSLTLSGTNNTFAGGAAIVGGTLAVGANNALPTATVLTFGSTASNGTLDLAGNHQTVGGLSIAATNAPALQLIGNSSTSGNALLDFSSTGSSEFNGTIQDDLGSGTMTAALAVSGGTLVLSGTNSFTGGTTVSNGTLILTNNEALADGSSLTVGNASDFAPAAVAPALAASQPPTIAAVPEPGTLLLLAAAGLAASAVWRKKRSR